MSTRLKVCPPALSMTEDEWKVCLQEGRRDSVLAILEFGRRIYEFQRSCEKKSGGSVFASRVKEWLSMSNGTAQCWVRIGAEHAKLLNCIEKLPASWGTIYNICELPAPEIEKHINPDMTRDDVKDLVERRRAAGRRVEMAAHREPSDESKGSHYQLEWEAERVKREAADREQQAWTAKAYAEKYGDAFPDGRDRDLFAEVTALHAVLAMPLRARLEWVEAYGFNACVVLGVPRGLAQQTYRYLCRHYESVLKADEEEARRSKQTKGQIEILVRAARELCSFSGAVEIAPTTMEAA